MWRTVTVNLHLVLDNEYMDRKNITCLISFIINITKQFLFATMRGSLRNVYSMPIQDKPKFPYSVLVNQVQKIKSGRTGGGSPGK